MRIALLGGTGDIGEGLALRIGSDTDHQIIVGSRDSERAENAAEEYATRLQAQERSSDITGTDNTSATTDADIIILSIPPFHIGDTVETISDQLEDDQILVSPAVGMQGDDDGLHYHPPGIGSITELVADRAPDNVPVVGAFHNLSAGRLANLDAPLDVDTLVVADDDSAKTTIIELANEMSGLRALDVGPIANAPEVESVTPLVINIARYNDDLHEVGVSFR